MVESSLGLFKSSNISTTPTVFSYSYKFIHPPLVLAICLFGIVCNLANIVILTKPKMRTSPTNVILTGLSSAQICLLINYVCNTIFGIIDDDCNTSTKTYGWMVYLLLNVNLNVLFHTIGLVHTSLIAVFRYIAVAFAATRSHWVTVERAKICVFVTYALVPLACTTFYFNSKIVESRLPANCSSHTVNLNLTVNVYELSFTTNKFLLAYNFWMLATVCKLLPCFCLAALSALLLYELQKVQQRRHRLRRQASSNTLLEDQQHHRITIMLVVVVLLFVIVEMPQGVLNLIAAVAGFDNVRFIHGEVADFFDMLTVFYSSVNFVLYCAMSSQFRQCFEELFWSSCMLKLKSETKPEIHAKTVYMPVKGADEVQLVDAATDV